MQTSVFQTMAQTLAGNPPLPAPSPARRVSPAHMPGLPDPAVVVALKPETIVDALLHALVVLEEVQVQVVLEEMQ